MTTLWDSLRGSGMKILVLVFYNSFWETLVVEILVASFKRLRGPYVISCRSCEKMLCRLALRSWRCSGLVLVWKYYLKCSKEVLVWTFCEILYVAGPGMGFWCEVLMSRHSVVYCAKTNCQPDLLLFHSCCLYLVHWLHTPGTVWGLLPTYFFDKQDGLNLNNFVFPHAGWVKTPLFGGYMKMVSVWQRTGSSWAASGNVIRKFWPWTIPSYLRIHVFQFCGKRTW